MKLRILGMLLAVMMAQPIVHGEEGMWLFNDLPRDYLKEKYGFSPSDEWAEHLMLASVRFNSGGSASFISPQGLVLTNHHVASDTLQKLSTAERNLLAEGFYARSFEEELKTPDLELNQLVAIEDVTDQVNAAVKPNMSPAEAAEARRAVMAQIEKESLDRTGLRSDVVTLYGGGKYHLYRYKKYTDVRLVWAPELSAALFGGDPDNFEYPRYCLDVTMFRVYEDGKPAKTEHYLKWSENGAEDGELVFVSGNPGSTRRIYTVAALKYQRDVRLPFVLDYLRRREILLQQYSLNGPEAERQARDELFSIQNSRKAYGGMLLGLQDAKFFERREKEEEALRDKVASTPELQKYSQAWQTIAEVQPQRAKLLRETASFGSRLYQIAETLVLMAAEDQKPSGERLREFRDSARESLRQDLFSPAPIYPELEQTLLADSLGLFTERRGGDHPLVQTALAGKNPQERAAELIQGTQLANVDARKRLAEGGIEAIRASDDPLVQLAREMEAEYRRVYKANEQLDEIEKQAYAQIADAQFATQGTSMYPDATFTLRLAFGTVKGYVEGGKPIPPMTRLGGAFEHAAAHGNRDPWKLPDSYFAARDKLDLDAPLNFVCTADIVGGNSGSPVVNRNNELVGIIFDGNIQSLTSTFYYTDEVARAVAVHSSGVREALKTIYKADRILTEINAQ